MLLPGGPAVAPISRRNAAFSLLEMLAAVTIIAILAVLVFVNRASIIDSAENARCLSNLRSLHTALATSLQDKGTWPQEPDGGDSGVFIDSDFWMRELAPYGIGNATWTCPSLSRLVRRNPTMDIPAIHYSPALFEPGPSAPFQFSTQPWIVEVASVHRRGANICFPDGSIRPLQDVLKSSNR